MAAGISGAERPRSGAALQPTPRPGALPCFASWPMGSGARQIPLYLMACSCTRSFFLSCDAAAATLCRGASAHLSFAVLLGG